MVWFIFSAFNCWAKLFTWKVIGMDNSKQLRRCLGMRRQMAILFLNLRSLSRLHHIQFTNLLFVVGWQDGRLYQSVESECATEFIKWYHKWISQTRLLLWKNYRLAVSVLTLAHQKIIRVKFWFYRIYCAWWFITGNPRDPIYSKSVNDMLMQRRSATVNRASFNY